ncbi:MAG: nicotinate (nicotinamide) nucleotide adenylyltransferase [Chlamydiales bacterium]|nr:nicotinate (nicotinamide) nucleotide adenylyltransferase [Chlamydiales bacterium]
MGKKIAIFGGSFDPVHIGHVALVVAMQEAHDLDCIFIIPANQNPHKAHGDTQDKEHRLAMLQMAFQDLPYCKVLTLELEREGPSYTIDTVAQIKKLYPDDTLYLIVGEDTIATFGSWKRVDELMSLTQSLVARRQGVDTTQKNEWLKAGMTNTPYFEVSSTQIRNRLKKKLYCGHLLNNQVYNYIQQNHLYE